MGFAEGFAAGWGMVDTMMARKHQQEMDARSMAIQEAAAQRAAELFPLQKQQAEGTIAGQTLQNAAAQQTIDYNTDTAGLRVDALK
ncbi:MAG TPA: hypothetical protein PLL36_10035, partial [Candidatus Hydrogenedentes bacterium]|nr:hypothetical protein [Candidatus Hydrogenedentota bacterium]